MNAVDSGGQSGMRELSQTCGTPVPDPAGDDGAAREKQDSLDAMAYGVAHDFNNLLAAMQGHARVALKTLPSAAVCRDHLMEIESAATRALAFSRRILLTSGRGRFSFARVASGEVLEPLLRAQETHVPAGIRLHIEMESPLPDFHADVHCLQELLQELVQNAVDAMIDSPGELRLSVSLCMYEQPVRNAGRLHQPLPPGRYLALDVDDGGPGIPLALRSRVFDPFFSTRLRAQGLGLAVARGIVLAHDGAIQLEDRPLRGTRVRVLFPCLPAAD